MYRKGSTATAENADEAVKWLRLSADQGNLAARNTLGVLYASGQGVPANRIVAYALYMLSEGSTSAVDNRADWNRILVDERLKSKEIGAAQDLSREMAKSKNLLAALDQYIQKVTPPPPPPPAKAESAVAPVHATPATPPQ